MSSNKYLQEHWSRGFILMTADTRKWTQEKIDQNNEHENKMVFAGFTAHDQGRSRKLICTCKDKQDATFIAAAPDMYRLLLSLWEQVKEGTLVGIDPLSSSQLEYLVALIEDTHKNG